MTAILFPVVSIAPWWAVLSLWIACLVVVLPLVLVGLREARRVSSSRVRRLVAGLLSAVSLTLAWQYIIAPCGPMCQFCLIHWPYWFCWI